MMKSTLAQGSGSLSKTDVKQQEDSQQLFFIKIQENKTNFKKKNRAEAAIR
jgi:hypothetical protein